MRLEPHQDTSHRDEGYVGGSTAPYLRFMLVTIVVVTIKKRDVKAGLLILHERPLPSPAFGLAEESCSELH